MRDSSTARLTTRGVRPTSQRLEIAEVLFAKPQHLSADQVLGRLLRQGSQVSKATVYNTLHLFAERGIVREVTVDPTRTYYDSCTEAHYHLYNIDTGELTDIPIDAVPIQSLPATPAGTDTVGVDVVIRIRNRSDGDAAAG